MNLYDFVENDGVGKIEVLGTYLLEPLEPNDFTLHQVARIFRLVHELEARLDTSIKQMDFLIDCMDKSILNGECEKMTFPKNFSGVGIGLQKLRKARKNAETVLIGIRDRPDSVKVRSSDVGTEASARYSVVGNVLTLNTNSKRDWKKVDDDELRRTLLHELFHVADYWGSHDEGFDFDNAHLFETLADADICTGHGNDFFRYIMGHEVLRDCCNKLSAQDYFDRAHEIIRNEISRNSK